MKVFPIPVIKSVFLKKMLIAEPFSVRGMNECELQKNILLVDFITLKQTSGFAR